MAAAAPRGGAEARSRDSRGPPASFSGIGPSFSTAASLFLLPTMPLPSPPRRGAQRQECEEGRQTAEAGDSVSRLVQLPHWLLLRVAWFLPAVDVLQLEACCRTLKETCCRWDGLWRHRMVSDFVRRYESLPAALDLSGRGRCSCETTGGGCCSTASQQGTAGGPPAGASSSGSRGAPLPHSPVTSGGPPAGRARAPSPDRPGPLETSSSSVRRSTAYALTKHPFTWRDLYSRVCLLLSNMRSGLAHRRVMREALRPPSNSTIEGGLCVTLECRRLLWCSGEYLQCIDLDLGCMLWSAAIGAELISRHAVEALIDGNIIPNFRWGPPYQPNEGAPPFAPGEAEGPPPQLTPPGGTALWRSAGAPLRSPQSWRSRCHVVASASHAFTFVSGRLHVFCLQSGLLVREIQLGLTPQEAAAAASPMPIDVCHRNNQFAFVYRLGASFYHSETLEPLFRLQHVETVQLQLLQQQQSLNRLAYWGGYRLDGVAAPTDDFFDFCWAGAACTGRPLHTRTGQQQQQQQQHQQQQQQQQQIGGDAADFSSDSHSRRCGCFCHMNGVERGTGACRYHGCWDGWTTSSSSSSSSAGHFAAARCLDTDAHCSMTCCRLRCRHVVTWHSGMSRCLMIWSAAGGEGADVRLVYTLRGHESPVLQVRQLTDWRDMREYFLASLDAAGTVRLWHSAAFPRPETAAAAAAATAARAAATGPLHIMLPRRGAAPQQPAQALIEGDEEAAAAAGDPSSSSAAAAAAAAAAGRGEGQEEAASGDTGCIAVIPPMREHWVHRISLSCHGLLTLCRNRQVPQWGQQQQMLLLWALKPPSLASMRGKRKSALLDPEEQRHAFLLSAHWGETDPHQHWDRLLHTWRHLGNIEPTTNSFSTKVRWVLESRRTAAAVARLAANAGMPAGSWPAASRNPDRAPAASVAAAAASGFTASAAAAPAAAARPLDTGADSAAVPGMRGAPSHAAADAVAEAAVASPARQSSEAAHAAHPAPFKNCPQDTNSSSSSRSSRSSSSGIAAAAMNVFSGDGDSRSSSSCPVRQSNRSRNMASSDSSSQGSGSLSVSSGSRSSAGGDVCRLEVFGAYSLPFSAFFAEFSSRGLVSVLCSESKEVGAQGAASFPPGIPRHNCFRACLSDWLVFDLNRINREREEAACCSAAAADAELQSELATAAAAAESYDEETLANQRAEKSWWRDAHTPDDGGTAFQSFMDPATLQWRLQQQQQCAAEQQRVKDAVRQHRLLVLQWVERQRRRRYRAAATALAAPSAAAALAAPPDSAASVAKPLAAAAAASGDRAGPARGLRPTVVVATLPQRSPSVDTCSSGSSSTNSSNSSSSNSSNSSNSSSRMASRIEAAAAGSAGGGSEHGDSGVEPSAGGDAAAAVAAGVAAAAVVAEAFSKGGGGLYPWWPAAVTTHELHPLASVVWLRERGNAWALIDWKAVQVDATGTLVILDFAHPDASPICPPVFM
ncbi:hypothetical protein Esti_000674 [Eimeria stiedai]